MFKFSFRESFFLLQTPAKKGTCPRSLCRSVANGSTQSGGSVLENSLTVSQKFCWYPKNFFPPYEVFRAQLPPPFVPASYGRATDAATGRGQTHPKSSQTVPHSEPKTRPLARESELTSKKQNAPEYN